jgi:hypothetical protein
MYNLFIHDGTVYDTHSGINITYQKGFGKQSKKGKRFPIQKMWEPFSMGTFILIPQ